MADVGVRPASVADAAAVARVQLQTWRIAYRDALPPHALALEERDLAPAWEHALTSPPAGHRLLVAHEADAVVGIASCQPAEEADVPGPAGELALLLVEPRWGRRGHGSRLLAAAVDLWRAEGVVEAVTWVLEGDAVVEGFLGPAGWAPDSLVRTLESDERSVRQRRWRTAL